MARSTRAPAALRPPLAALTLCALAAARPLPAPAQEVQPAGVATPGQIVKVFDFNERPLGNFEDTPMYWQRMTGEGLPAYSEGQLDEQVGHAAPPAFRFTLRGGNIGYEYQRDDLAVAPDSDYQVEAYVRAEGLTHARAFVAFYLVDAAGNRITGSERVSPLVRSAFSTRTSDAEPWQRVEIPLYVDTPDAAGLRLQLWVLQTYVFDEPDHDAVDPVTPQDVDARVWFDDLALVRLPRLNVSFSNSAGLVQPGSQEALEVAIQNTAAIALAASLTIRDESGVECFRTTLEASAGAEEQSRVALPSLPPGTYQARLHAFAPDRAADNATGTSSADRTLRFAVLPELPGSAPRGTDLGIDLGPWGSADPAGAAELATSLGCGAIKIGLPMVDTSVDSEATRSLRAARDLAQQMALSGIETTGVILPPPTVSSLDSLPIDRLLTADDGWEEQLGPLLAFFGGHLSSLQLGAESAELRQPPAWDAATLDQVHHKLERFAAVPPLVLPRAVFDAAPTPTLLDPANVGLESGTAEAAGALVTARGFSGYSFWLPAQLPAWSLPWHLAFWFDLSGRGPGAEDGGGKSGGNHWVSLGLEREASTTPTDQLVDLVRRILLAKAVNPARVYVPAPFELTTSGGRAAWQPTEQYLPLRTLFHALAGTRAVAALTCVDDAVALLFQRGGEYTLVAWTWRETPGQARATLYTGPAASALTLTGAAYPLELDGPRAIAALRPTPVIIRGVDGPLLQLQDSFRVSPTFLQLHAAEPRPVLTLSNPYDSELAGTIDVQAPPAWQVTPDPIQLQLGPGETLNQTLSFDIPPRQIAAAEKLQARLHVRRPDPVELEFEIPVQIGLRDVVTEITLEWDGGDLVVQQSLRNLLDQAVSFDAFCQPVGRTQHEALFLNIPPGESATHTYRLVDARGLVGTQLWLGIWEIGGRRSLDQLVVVPP